ncbi:dual specificity protein phosphatase [Agrobacterium sp.]|uniref:dual specificity protein phosphatase family protein n=1 Tax=Agrobacterium sp. TaxID=361 RepID=UPI0028AF2AF7|nr:dual specificity protein phosphatase [Agrobacterium sp.]
MSASPRYDRPHLSLIESYLPGWNVDLYIGGREAVCDPALLAQHDIKIIVNCAINFDVNFVTGRHPDDEAILASGPGLLRYYKLGLVDGAGNSDTMLLCGYYLLRGALDQTFPERASYPHREKGNVLVNCRAGRSRSVTLVSLFLHLEMPQTYPTLSAAIDHVRTRRQLHPDEWFETPKPQLIHAAEQAADMIRVVEARKKRAVA